GMKIAVTDELFENYPDAQIGLLIVKGINNPPSKPEIIELLHEAQEAVRARFEGQVVSQLPQVLPWREAYRQFGAKPKKYPSSIENLIKRTLKGEQLNSINSLVDIYNIVSLRHVLPVGAEDLSRMQGDLRLTIAGDNEPPVKLLGEKEARPPYPNEVIYTDDLGAICRRWNWKEADRTKLTNESRNVLFVIEILPPIERATLTNAMSDLEDLLHQFVGEPDWMKTAVLNSNSPQFEFSLS
ncbi:MAG: phenylalanine--tRNA ligase beta subunit-related protein, partial [Chloroflexota bacterium]